MNIKDISEKDLNNYISIVFQENSLLKMSIAENVKLYRKNASRDEIMRALKLAQCEDIITKLPNGIDSVYGSKGVYLSGGEVQRIAIARSLLNSPKVIIADEPTGNLDNETADGIMQLLTGINKKNGTAIVMVTHNRGIYEKYPGRIFVCKNEHCHEKKDQ